MSITIAPYGLITVSDAESTTGWTGVGSTLGLVTDIQREGTNCIGAQFSVETGSIYFTSGSRNLSTGSLIYAWNRIHTPVRDKFNGGVQIVLGDGTNRIGFFVGGSDDPGFDIGAWNCYVLDCTNLPTRYWTSAGSRGSLNLAAITQIGMAWVCPNTAKGNTDNMFVDIIRICNPTGGLQITGGDSTSPGTFAQIVSDDASTSAGKAYGIIRQLQSGIYGLQGNLLIGDLTGSTGVHFDDESAVVVLENHKHETGSGLPFNINLVSTNSSSFFRLGNAVGSGDTEVGAGGVQIRNASSGTLFRYDMSDSGSITCDLFGF